MKGPGSQVYKKLKNKYKTNIPKMLYNHHVKEGLTIQKMSKKYGIARASIYTLMDRFGIKTRNQSEALKIRYKNMTEKEKKEITKEANKKSKKLAKQGNWGFQKEWKQNREKMMEYVSENIPKIIENRTNGMKGVTGPAHPNWNPDLTDEEREKKRRELYKTNWREKVFERDNYTCQTCGDDKGGNLEAHHKYSYMAYPEKRTDISNGVTL